MVCTSEYPLADSQSLNPHQNTTDFHRPFVGVAMSEFVIQVSLEPEFLTHFNTARRSAKSTKTPLFILITSLLVLVHNRGVVRRLCQLRMQRFSCWWMAMKERQTKMVDTGPRWATVEQGSLRLRRGKKLQSGYLRHRTSLKQSKSPLNCIYTVNA